MSRHEQKESLIGIFGEQDIEKCMGQIGNHGNIYNALKFWLSSSDWSYFNNCFDRGIRITDIDGIVETQGYFLVLEVKEPGKALPKGQRIMFEALCSIKRFTIIIIWGTVETPERFQIWDYRGTPLKDFHGDQATLSKLQEVVSRWFRCYDKK